jgi:putative endonuclease
MSSSPAPGIVRNSWIGLQASALRRLAAMARRRSPLPTHLQTGLDGEREAIFYLRRQGYTIVARRWRNPKLRGDLDLIAWHLDTLCFIEIKTLSRRGSLPAEMAVDSDKQETLRRLALSYIRRLPEAARQAPMRFDVLSVYLDPRPDFALNKGAFQWA